jgi:hypothetical protein
VTLKGKDIDQMGVKQVLDVYWNTFLICLKHLYLTLSKYLTGYLTCGLFVSFIIFVCAAFSYVSNHFLHRIAFATLLFPGSLTVYVGHVHYVNFSDS